MYQIEISQIIDSVNRSLSLLSRTYSSLDGGGGGWYHRLESEIPGPSATAVALHSYLLFGRVPDHYSEALAFLSARQITTGRSILRGGWPVNTSAGQPVLESTSLVVRSLSLSRPYAEPSPDLSLALSWISENQNRDGGWGSLRDQPSRVWLTGMAVRALATSNTFGSTIRRGVEWLLRSRDTQGIGWGEKPNDSERSPTRASF